MLLILVKNISQKCGLYRFSYPRRIIFGAETSGALSQIKFDMFYRNCVAPHVISIIIDTYALRTRREIVNYKLKFTIEISSPTQYR